jgi:dTDP-4-dehydrorhamnose reductase
MRVAVTGAGGRLGRALIEALEEAPFTGPKGPIAWRRPELDLDTVTSDGFARLVGRDRPEVVVHAAAWTDVDGCARDPDLALRRNGLATGVIAEVCASLGCDLVIVSTNEVFDGRRTDGAGYAPGDERHPINAYGVSKLEGEVRAARAYADGADAPASGTDTPAGRLAIVRTSWLHGPPGNDFPAKIAAAALRSRAAGEPLRVVGDEVGCPTYAPDLAEAIVELLGADAITQAPARHAVHHLVNGGRASRADWAREVLRLARIEVPLVEVPSSTWIRASTPPAWAVLELTELPSGEPMRDWREALEDAAPALIRSLPRG